MLHGLIVRILGFVVEFRPKSLPGANSGREGERVLSPRIRPSDCRSVSIEHWGGHAPPKGFLMRYEEWTLAVSYRRAVAFVAALVVLSACFPAMVRADGDVEDWITQFTGSPIYPSQYGLPGHPGVQNVEGKPIYKTWGYAERLPYPGSVEHVRVDEQRYIPVVPQCNARTLIKNFRATELPGLAAGRIVDYAEPIYYVPKYPKFHDGGKIADAFDTGMKNAPVKVMTWGPGDAPIELDLGSLGPSVYVVRVIAATPTEND